MDILSDVLSLLKPRTQMAGGFDQGGDWSIRFDRHAGIKFYSVISGQCWLSVDGVAEPARINAGDCFLMPLGRPFRLASDLSLPSIDAYELLKRPAVRGIRTLNGGGDCLTLGCYFAFTGTQADMLLNVLPPVVHLRKESDRAALRWSLERLMLELREPRPGGLLFGQQLATMILVQALRLHIEDGPPDGVGWLFALSDPQIGAAITAIHENPADRWTLESLADCAAMSRTSFAVRFKETVGESPIQYVTRWRMMVAGDKLMNSKESIAAISRAMGYESESAFSTAFKRVMDCSPRQYGGRRKSPPAARRPKSMA